MTPRQAEVLAFLRRYMAAHGGVAPSFAEMVAGLGAKSNSHVFNLLASLEREGRIRRIAGRERAITIVDDLSPFPDEVLLSECRARGLIDAPHAVAVPV